MYQPRWGLSTTTEPVKPAQTACLKAGLHRVSQETVAVTTTASESVPPTLILTNDDGLEAPGMRALFDAAAGLGDRTVIAPVSAWSSRSHAVTTNEAFRVVERPDGWFGVEGTPADCVRVGLHHLAPDAAWVFAGINAGGN